MKLTIFIVIASLLAGCTINTSQLPIGRLLRLQSTVTGSEVTYQTSTGTPNSGSVASEQSATPTASINSPESSSSSTTQRTPAVIPPLVTNSNILPSTKSLSIPTLEGDLVNSIAFLEKKMPRSGTEGYLKPADSDISSFSELMTMLLQGKVDDASSIAAPFDYELIQYTDRNDENQKSYLLQERDPKQNGWGLYAFRMDSASPIIIEAPHPLADAGTPLVALQIYRTLDARAAGGGCAP